MHTLEVLEATALVRFSSGNVRRKTSSELGERGNPPFLTLSSLLVLYHLHNDHHHGEGGVSGWWGGGLPFYVGTINSSLRLLAAGEDQPNLSLPDAATNVQSGIPMLIEVCPLVMDGEQLL